MSVEEQIRVLVIETLKISPDLYSEDLAAEDIPQWDSIANIRLLQNTEAAFNISFDVIDAIAVENVSDLIELVQRYRGLA
jgi:acyl carrier protein